VERTLPRQMQLIASLMQPLNQREAASLNALLTRLRAVDSAKEVVYT
jgi:hypothetical protein